MDRTKTLAALAALAIASCGGSNAVVVASKNFTEQVILGEIVAQHLEKLGFRVERRLNLGGTLLAHEALKSGQIDLYPEYTGTALTAILGQAVDRHPETVLARVRAAYQKLGVEWLGPLGIDNGFAMAVPGALARKHGLETLSDAAASKIGWMPGIGYEFETRADGLPALDRTYAFHWAARPKTMDLGLLYKAIEQKQVNMIAANATDALLAKLDLRVLADDRRVFPPYEVAIAARRETLDRLPGLREALTALSGKFDNARMRELNYLVDVERRSVADAATQALAGLR
ncbi:MAG: glycine betaine ABC transporter substrate-binding protein [Bryobacteraceae bacterium]